MNPSEKKLLRSFNKLAKAEQESLLAFAEFLESRAAAEEEQSLVEPQLTPRPQQESVVAAIKRLSASYSMLDKPELLNETSVLMTQHVMQGRGAEEVIDELEALFVRFYQEMKDRQ